MNRLRNCIAEPYRIFFPLGIFWAFLGIGHWILYAAGVLSQYSMQFHSHVQIHAYMGCFVTGFLMTALPRFASARPANPLEILIFLILVNAAPVLYWNQMWISGRFCFAAWLAALAVFAGRRFASRKPESNIQPPVEFVWIPAALFLGIAGVLLLSGTDLRWLAPPANKIGKLFLEQAFILAIVLGVGSFLGPRLMGTFQPFFKVGDAASVKSARSAAFRKQLAAMSLFIVSFILEGSGKVIPAYFLRTFVIGFIYWRSRTLVLKPLLREPFVWMLWLSFWMVFLGHVAAAVFPLFRAALIHIVFIGGYGLMTFAVGLMVIFSHGGETPRLKKHAVILSVVTLLTAAALSLRIAAIFAPEQFFLLLGSASAVWLFGALIWLILISNALFRNVSAEEFERCHEEAKQRVQNLKSGKPLS